MLDKAVKSFDCKVYQGLLSPSMSKQLILLWEMRALLRNTGSWMSGSSAEMSALLMFGVKVAGSLSWLMGRSLWYNAWRVFSPAEKNGLQVWLHSPESRHFVLSFHYRDSTYFNQVITKTACRAHIACQPFYWVFLSHPWQVPQM